MKKNLRSMIEQYEESTPECLVDMNRYDMIESTGMMPDLAHKKSAHLTAAWRVEQQPHVSVPMGGSDLTGYRYLTFSVFAVGAVGFSFRLMFDNSTNGNGKNGYACNLSVTKDGWNDYRIELPFLHGIRDPQGWDRIGSVTFDAVSGFKAQTTLYIDSLYLREVFAAPLYAKMPELKGAALFSKTGSFSIVDRKRIVNAPDGTDAKPFEEDGTLWLPMAPVAAGIAHSAVVDTLALTLTFSYRRKKYSFSADSDHMTVNGEPIALGFFPKTRGGTLFFPADFVREFFRWRQLFTDSMGLIVLSNRRNIFQAARDAQIIWNLIADLTFQRPSGSRILNDLHRRFPNATRDRLLLGYDDLMQLRRDAKTDVALKAYVNALKEQYGTSSTAFREPPIAVNIPRDAGKLTDDLSHAADRLIAFATLYRVTGDKQYCERTAAECEALADFSDWNTQSMACVGNVSMAMAIAYDWCHHMWSESRKAIAERAMLRNGMRVGLDCYDGKRRMWINGGTASAVTNAGMLAMALALADIYPETSLKLLDRILRNAEPCFASYAPDGGYAEGVAAWEKSARALSLMIAMLQKACGSDYGLFAAPGFSATAYFPICTETINGMWNYHNSAALPTDTSMAFWFARQTGDMIPAWIRRQQLLSGQKNVHPFDILFYLPVDDTLTPQLPLDAVFRKAGLAIMRSGWGNCDLFAGLHGGSNAEVNGDLDAGSILLDCGGVRFFAETGGNDALPLLLRRRAIGQNTITVNPTEEPDPDQNPTAAAELTEMRSNADRAYAVVDMTSTNDAFLRAKRGVLLTERRTTVVIQDEMVLKTAGVLRWTVYTPAAVTLCNGGKCAKLEKDGQTLLCKIGGLGQARFTVEPVENSALSRLTIRTEIKERARLSVACRLISDGDSVHQKLYEVAPISTWGTAEQET